MVAKSIFISDMTANLGFPALPDRLILSLFDNLEHEHNIFRQVNQDTVVTCANKQFYSRPTLPIKLPCLADHIPNLHNI